MKFYKKDKITIYAVQTKVTSSNSFENEEFKIYYLNNSRKRVYEEYGLFVKDCQYSWPRITSSRSIIDLERKYHSDFERLKNIFSSFEIQITKIGAL